MHDLGVRDPGGYLDQQHPGAEVGARYFRGSGTAQATAVVSGAAALLLQHYPSRTPYQAKQLLTATVTPLNSVPVTNQGAGLLNVRKAQLATPPAGSDATAGYGSGTGSLEGARGSAHVSCNGVDLTGERDSFGAAWNGQAMASAELAGSSWEGATWNGNDWTGADWTGTSWTSRTWSSRTWSARSWTGGRVDLTDLVVAHLERKRLGLPHPGAGPAVIPAPGATAPGPAPPGADPHRHRPRQAQR